MTHGVFERVCEGCTQCLIQGKGVPREGRHTEILEFILIIILEAPFPWNPHSVPAVDAEVPFGKKKSEFSTNCRTIYCARESRTMPED